LGGHKDNIVFASPATGFLADKNNTARIYQSDNVAQTTRLFRTADDGAHWSVVPLSH
jgi:hypothetical protein